MAKRQRRNAPAATTEIHSGNAAAAQTRSPVTGINYPGHCLTASIFR